VLAGDISPIDVITHLPVLCEDHDIPYIYVPSKDVRQGLGCTARGWRSGGWMGWRHVCTAAPALDHKPAQDLASAGQTKRPTSCLLILPKPLKGDDVDEELAALYKETAEKLKKVNAL